MNVILLENNRNLGTIGKQVSVKPGYARNYLIPKGKAVLATPANIEKFEARRAELEKAAAKTLAEAKTRAEKLATLTITIQTKVGDDGKLFGSIGTKDIAKAVTEKGVELSKHEILLPEGPLRHAGEHEINLQLHNEINAMIKVVVVSEEA